MGRPSLYSPELAAEICARISEGRSLRSICTDEDMPDARTVFRWLAKEENDLFRQQYARATEARSDAMAEEILDIADDATNDWMMELDRNGDCRGWRENGDSVQRSKLRVEARKWLASKMAPKKYGDRMSLTGESGGPLQVIVQKFSDGA